MKQHPPQQNSPIPVWKHIRSYKDTCFQRTSKTVQQPWQPYTHYNMLITSTLHHIKVKNQGKNRSKSKKTKQQLSGHKLSRNSCTVNQQTYLVFHGKFISSIWLFFTYLNFQGVGLIQELKK